MLAHLPLYTVKRHSTDKPWVNDTFSRLIRGRQYAFRHGNLDACRSYRNKVQRSTEVLRRKYYEHRLADLRCANPRNWWMKVQAITGFSSTGDGALAGLANDRCGGDMKKLANEVNIFFQRVSRQSDLQRMSEEILKTIPLKQSEETPIVIRQEEVEQSLLSTKVFKSPGPDRIPNWILHDLAPYISRPVTAIFNASISEGVVPVTWKKSNVVPVPESNPPKSIEDDLRPISLTPTLAKHLEWFIGQQLLSTVAGKLDTKQFGALKGRSTTHALVDILHNWNAALDSGSSIRAVFVDYAKTFDMSTIPSYPPGWLRWVFRHTSSGGYSHPWTNVSSEWKLVQSCQLGSSWMEECPRAPGVDHSLSSSWSTGWNWNAWYINS